jgi:hypothetical protein
MSGSVGGAVREDGGNLWTSGVALREEASNHLPGPWLTVPAKSLMLVRGGFGGVGEVG